MHRVNWAAFLVMALASSPAVAQFPPAVEEQEKNPREKQERGKINQDMQRISKLGPASKTLAEQENPSVMSPTQPMNPPVVSPPEYILSISALAFAAIIAGLAAWMRVKQVIGGNSAFKLIGLAVVVGGGLFLIAAGYSQEQITGVVGLLGTGLGFIFGKDLPNDSSPQRNET